MRLISAGSLVRAQSGPSFYCRFSFTALTNMMVSLVREGAPSSGTLPSLLIDRQCASIYCNRMTSLFRSAALLFTIFLSASAVFSGQWTEVPGAGLNNSGLYGITAVSANDVWAVGGLGGGRALIEHWDGTNWSVAAVLPRNTALTAMAALSSSDVWAVGQNGVQTLVEHWNGQRWVAVPSPNLGSTYNTLRGCASSRVTTRGRSGTHYHLLPVTLTF